MWGYLYAYGDPCMHTGTFGDPMGIVICIRGFPYAYGYYVDLVTPNVYGDPCMHTGSPFAYGDFVNDNMHMGNAASVIPVCI
jgi:hypothetical protein